ncbi:hypothetical protein EJ02DRAFT_450745 [Clathrospora elynae]|uniref:Uncharacterized protein n=1 Tax=Clathrospora elynae TaxID=706981 RepID=A0A6A5T2P7_9PLEO|nr:hypothetical protein EJ02DRAFT_450745 [Clathrospora elynae]
MALGKRYFCDEETRQCYPDDDGFWFSDTGIIVKWAILAAFFFVFFGWFVGGHIHAKRRLRSRKPLLAYHRFLIPYQERRRHGQVPQNHFSFYQTQNPYGPNAQSGPYAQRQDGTFAEPPPLYQNNDAPPQYFAPPSGPPKAQDMEMPQYGAPQAGPQQNGVVGSNVDVEQGQTQELPPRPAKAKIMGMLGKLRR